MTLSGCTSPSSARRRVPYRQGQYDGIEVAMAAMCQFCLGSMSDGSDLSLTNGWVRGTIKSGIHIVKGKRHQCRAAKLIPLLISIPNV